MEELGFETGIAKLDLAIEVFETEEFFWHSNTTRPLDQQTIRRMLGHFRNLVSGMIKNPGPATGANTADERPGTAPKS